MQALAFGTITLIAVQAVASELPGTRAVPAPWTAPYLDTELQMEVDLDWIMIKADADILQPLTWQSNSVAAMLHDAIPSSAHGWSYVPVRGAMNADDIATTVQGMATTHRTFASPVFLGGTHRLPWIPTDTLIVQMRPDAIPSDFQILDRNLGGHEGMHRISVPVRHGLDTLRVSHALAAQEDVQWAQPNAIWWAQHFYTPNDPDFSSQWALNNSNDMDMNGPECWDVTFGDASIVVSILDDGIDQSHPDINSIPGEDFTDENTGGDHTTVCDGHGSCVGGCVSATIDNNIGVTGIAPHCKVMATRIFNAIEFFGFCFGFIETTDAWIVNGIGWAVNQGARVTNSSWGGGAPSSAVTAAFNNAEAAGVINFGAAGNDGSSTVSYPASLASVNAVSAINSSGNLASFSTFGNGIFCSAPGENVRTTDWTGSGGFDGGDHVNIDGTSFAAPYAAGVAALILSMDDSLTPDEVEDIMAATAKDRGTSGYDTQYGWGIVDASAAVNAVDTTDPCPGDVNQDGSVGTNDILALIDNWGSNDPNADINGDGTVSTDDVLALIAAWGPC